jgi:pyruvate dehydrogenase E2 component (dihydrolipoamide acetyltransferase)
MARWEFKLPDIGEGVAEGEIVAWLVVPGDVVAEDQPLVELMTDKATVTITAPRAGVVVETRGRPGEVVSVHSVLAVFELPQSGSSGPHANGATAHGPSSPHAAPASGDAAGRTNPTGPPPGEPAVETHPFATPPPATPPLATPATRKLARELNVDLHEVIPSGPQGRVTRRDVEAHVHSGAAPSAPSAHGEEGATPRQVGHLGARANRPAAPARTSSAPPEERLPLAGLRRRIAQKMALSKTTAAHFTFVEECDATELKATRARLAPEAQTQGVKLTLLPFVVKAVVGALRHHPLLNASLDDGAQEIVLRRYYNIGIATATDSGLVVPVVKDADRKSLLDVARDIDRLASEARAGKSKLEDLQGSTFTITSLGARGGLLATPIINYPEVAILGVHQIKERPVVRNGQIVIGEVMLVSLSFDHRVVDGHVGAAFAYDVIGYLERPDRLLLEMA